MRKLTRAQWKKMDGWMRENARPYDLAKWDFLFGGGSKQAIVQEVLRYQNPDGGIGHGFEADVLLPLSAAIPTAEAIFLAYDYELDCSEAWFSRLLAYFEHTVQDIPKYWEDAPREIMEYPHAPWWNYSPCTKFSPNPCAAVASAFVRFGTPGQRELGLRIVGDCLNLLTGEGFCGDHDTLNIMTLVQQLQKAEPALVTEQVLSSMRRRIRENTCFDPAKWSQYFFQPLDYVSSPDSPWYDVVEEGIEQNIVYWLDNLNEQGVWTPNFSWGTDSEASRQATRNWTGYLAVKRAKILLAFDRIEQ